MEERAHPGASLVCDGVEGEELGLVPRGDQVAEDDPGEGLEGTDQEAVVRGKQVDLPLLVQAKAVGEQAQDSPAGHQAHQPKEDDEDGLGGDLCQVLQLEEGVVARNRGKGGDQHGDDQLVVGHVHLGARKDDGDGAHRRVAVGEEEEGEQVPEGHRQLAALLHGLGDLLPGEQQVVGPAGQPGTRPRP